MIADPASAGLTTDHNIITTFFFMIADPSGATGYQLVKYAYSLLQDST